MSPLAISRFGGMFLQQSIEQNQPVLILNYIAIISVALGITNLLPGDEDKVALLEEILGNVRAATQNAMALIGHALPFVAAKADEPCDCQSALNLAIWSDRNLIPADVSHRLSPLLGKYLG